MSSSSPSATISIFESISRSDTQQQRHLTSVQVTDSITSNKVDSDGSIHNQRIIRTDKRQDTNPASTYSGQVGNLQSQYQRMASATVGAILTSLLMTPFDVVKTRMQSSFVSSNAVAQGVQANVPNNKFQSFPTIPKVSQELGARPSSYTGTFNGMVQIARNEGIFGLWRGLTPTLIMSIPSTVIYYVGYEHIRYVVAGRLQVSDSSPWIPLISGASARLLSASVISPIELIRTRLQAGQGKTSSVLRGVGKMVWSEGIHSLWRGLGSTLWRDVPFSAVYWVGYETVKSHLLPENSKLSTGTQSELIASFTAGSISGTVSAIITHPFDVAKTIQQVSSSSPTSNAQSISMSRVLSSVVQSNGWRGLFTGLAPRIAKVAPACGIMISTYEVGKKLFAQLP